MPAKNKRKAASRVGGLKSQEALRLQKSKLLGSVDAYTQTESLFSSTKVGEKRKEVVNITPRSKTRMQPMKPSHGKPEGRRLITISGLESALNWAAKHGNECEDCEIEIVEEQRNGLECSFCVMCHNCKQKKFWVHNDVGTKSLSANEALVWGANATGVGYTGLKHAFTSMDIPFPDFNTFKKLEIVYSDQMSMALEKQMKENGKEEIGLAIALNQVIETPTGSIPWTSVYCDGQWSKRCYNQKGTALSGSAAIIGLLSKKPLFVAVRNKFCYICKTNEGKAGGTPEHICFKNFSGSSSAMEASVIDEGFKGSMLMHGLIYKNLIGDGDSDVHMTVENIYRTPEYGYTVVHKIECKNHAIRRLNYNLLHLIKNTQFDAKDRKKFEPKIPSIGRSCQYAIELHAANKSEPSSLRKDILNVFRHVFGDHRSCSTITCKNGISIVPDKYKRPDFQPPNIDLDKSLAKNKNLDPQLSCSPLWFEATKIIQRLANLSDSLIINFTTNLVESFQSSICKMIQGKRTNLVLRGSYTRRVKAATLSFQHGPGWSHKAYKSIYNKSPSNLWGKRYREGIRLKTLLKMRKKKLKLKRTVVKVKPSQDECFSKTRKPLGNPFYGEHARRADVSEMKWQAMVNELEKSLQINTKAEQLTILNNTVRQWENDNFKQRRLQMITASNCGRIFALQDSTFNRCLLDCLLGPTANVAAMRWGKYHEADAVRLYESTMKCNVSSSGMFVSLENGVFGASPDGLIGCDGILEVKCPYSARHSAEEKQVVKACGYLRYTADGKVALKEGSNYFRQVVMQLNVSERKWCDFVVWTQGPSLPGAGREVPVDPRGFIITIHVERAKTIGIWNKMITKLLRFYRDDLAPELVDSRFYRNMPYKQPEYRMIANAKKKSRKRKGALDGNICETPFVSPKFQRLGEDDEEGSIASEELDLLELNKDPSSTPLASSKSTMKCCKKLDYVEESPSKDVLNFVGLEYEDDSPVEDDGNLIGIEYEPEDSINIW